MKNIRDDIKNNTLKRVYLIYGEEKYLVRSAKNMIINATVAKDDNMNFSKFSGKDCNPLKIIDLAQTLPFFAEHRVILLENTNWFKDSCDEIADYIKSIPQSCIIVFVESLVDKRNKLYKQVKTNGYICECNQATPKELSDWILRRLSKENKKITKDTMNYILEKLGYSMDNIETELDKLIAYTMDRDVITNKDIDEVCISEISGKIFEMIDAIGNRKQEKALKLYYDLISVREAPLKILYMLARQFNLMLQMKELSMKDYTQASIASQMKIQPFIVKKTLLQCKNFSLPTIRGAVKYCISVEEAVKQGNLNDLMAVELVIVKYSKEKK